MTLSLSLWHQPPVAEPIHIHLSCMRLWYILSQRNTRYPRDIHAIAHAPVQFRLEYSFELHELPLRPFLADKFNIFQKFDTLREQSLVEESNFHAFKA